MSKYIILASIMLPDDEYGPEHVEDVFLEIIEAESDLEADAFASNKYPYNTPTPQDSSWKIEGVRALKV